MLKKFTAIFVTVMLLAVMCIAGGCSSSSSGTSSGTSNLKTYIASNLTSDMGRELSSRFTNVVSSYSASDDIVNYVVSAADLAANEELREQVVSHLIQDKNVIIVEPTLASIKAFYKEIDEFLEKFEEQEAKTIAENGYSETELPDGVDRFLNQFRLAKTDDDLDSLIKIFGSIEIPSSDVQELSFDLSALSLDLNSTEPVLDILCFRGNDCYMADPCDDEATTEVIGPEIPEASLDVSEDASEDTSSDTVTAEVKSPEVLLSDGCIEWVNEYKPEGENSEAAVIPNTDENGAPVLTEDNAQSITICHSFCVTEGPEGYYGKQVGSVKMHVLLWTCHSFESGLDHIIFKNHITCFNQDLNCPTGTDETQWYNSYKWPEMYGPYFYELTPEVWVSANPYKSGILGFRYLSGDLEPMGATPIARTDGTTSYSEGFNYTVGGNVGVSASGPSVGLTGSFSGSEGVSRSVPDIRTERNDVPPGEKFKFGGFKWGFFGKHVKWTFRTFGNNKHEIAPSILRNQLDLTLNGGYKIKNTDKWTNKSAIYIMPWESLIRTEVLTEHSYRHRGIAGGLWRTFPQVPCRYRSTLSSSIKCSGYNPETSDRDRKKQEELETRLKNKIPAYKDQYPVAVLEDPNDSGSKGVLYLQQHGSSILKDIKTQITNMKQALRDAGYGDAGICRISITASDVSDTCPNPLCYIEVDLGSEEERKNE